MFAWIEHYGTLIIGLVCPALPYHLKLLQFGSDLDRLGLIGSNWSSFQVLV